MFHLSNKTFIEVQLTILLIYFSCVNLSQVDKSYNQSSFQLVSSGLKDDYKYQFNKQKILIFNFPLIR
jgi:hypothetical protein